MIPREVLIYGIRIQEIPPNSLLISFLVQSLVLLYYQRFPLFSSIRVSESLSASETKFLCNKKSLIGICVAMIIIPFSTSRSHVANIYYQKYW